MTYRLQFGVAGQSIVLGSGCESTVAWAERYLQLWQASHVPSKQYGVGMVSHISDAAIAHEINELLDGLAEHAATVPFYLRRKAQLFALPSGARLLRPLWDDLSPVERDIYPVQDFSQPELYVQLPNEIIVLSSARPALSVARLTRQVLLNKAAADGFCVLRGGAFVRNGQATVIVGPKGAGKTSLLLDELGKLNTAFLGNSRLLVGIGNEGELWALGVPITVGIRGKTLLRHADLYHHLVARAISPLYPQPSWWTEDLPLGAAHGMKVGLLPSELVSILGRETCARAPVGQVVVLQPKSEDNQLATANVIRDEWLAAGDPDYPDAFRMLPPAAEAGAVLDRLLSLSERRLYNAASK